MLKKIIKFILIILVMSLIFNFSSDNSTTSTKKSDGLISKVGEIIIGRNLTKEEKNNYINKYVILVRKSAHFIIYLFLGILLISFIKEFKINNSLQLALLTSLFYACTDEIHQYFVPGRSCEVRDVLIDTLGAFTGIILYKIIYKSRRSLHEQKETTC